MNDRIQKIITRHKELEELLATPEVVSDLKKMETLGREYNQLGKILPTLREYLDASGKLEEAKSLLKTESDQELIELAQEEVHELEEQLPQLEEQVKVILVPRDPADT